MNITIKCTLCSGDSCFFEKYRCKDYYRCKNCSAVFMNPEHFPDRDDERNRYLEHNNDVNDPGYQKFVQPVVDGIMGGFSVNHKGLDFGAGTGPVISKLLRDSGYCIELYDPFFWNDPEKLEFTYDYIACCEVIEHFREPMREFQLLKSLLNENGSLFIMTSIYDEAINFKKWKYKDDRTHLFFYHKNSLQWIKNRFNFSSLTISGKLIHYTC